MIYENKLITSRNPYENLYTEFGYDSRSLGWSKTSQDTRFKRIIDLHNFAESSLLDIGSGFSDFPFFLLENGVKLDAYSGIEIYEPFFQIACNRIRSLNNTSYKVLNCSWEDLNCDSKFEITVAIGTFNFKIEDNYLLVSNFIDCMIKTGCEILIISLLSARAPKTIREANEDKFYYDPDVLAKLLLKRELSFQIIDDYLPHDFMLKIQK